MKHKTLTKLEHSLETFKEEGFCSQGEIQIINSKINKIDELQNSLDFTKYNIILNKNIDYFNNYSNDLQLFVSSNRFSDLVISAYVKMIDKGLIDETFNLSSFERNFEEVIEKFGLIYLEPIDKILVGVQLWL